MYLAIVHLKRTKWCSEERNISVSQGNLRISPGCCRKIYIPRDYTLGSGIKFSHKLPVELEGKIDKEKFESTINTLNLLYAEAERATCSSVPGSAGW